VALICELITFTGGAEWLTGARACPNRSVVRPSGEAEGMGPDSDSCEEVALSESAQVIGSNVDNASLIDFPRCYVTGRDEVP